MADGESPSARYRRLTRECLEVARAFPDGDQRDVLLQMAQVWQRLADDYAGSTLLSLALGAERPALQQQQQIQPDDDKKE